MILYEDERMLITSNIDNLYLNNNCFFKKLKKNIVHKTKLANLEEESLEEINKECISYFLKNFKNDKDVLEFVGMF